jgi:hypothetical protein
MQYCADIPKVIREGSHKESWPLTQFIPKSFEIETWPKEDTQALENLTSLIIHILQTYEKKTNISREHIQEKEIYKVVKSVDKTYAFEKDFIEIHQDWETYYPILTQNKYQNIWAYLCKKYLVAKLPL